MRKCKNCLQPLLKKHKIKYCSNKCQQDFQYKNYIDLWKDGKEDGSYGIETKNVCRHIKHYLLEKYNEKCSKCGWNERHPITCKVPLEVDHIDGNSDNNSEKNLTILCPNCHALTPYFRNLNKGNGRVWRKDKYLKNKA